MSSWDADAEIKRIRRDLAAYPADLVDWEAACLKHVANLLEALEQARGEWGSLSTRLNETKTRLSATEAEREGAVTARDDVKEQLERARTDLVELRASVDTITDDLESTRAVLEREKKVAASQRAKLKTLAEARDRGVAFQEELEATRARLKTARTELERRQEAAKSRQAEYEKLQAEHEKLRIALATAERERDELAATAEATRTELGTRQEEATAQQAELEKLRTALAATERERDELALSARLAADLQAQLKETRSELEATAAKGAGAQGDAADMGRRLALAQDTLVETRQRLAKAELERERMAEAGEEWGAVRAALGEAQSRLQALKKECEELRQEGDQKFMQICELRVRENRMETERDDAKRKKRKILAKVHSVLDEAGVPAAEDTSFGERIRWLKQRIDELEANAPDRGAR